jgi:cell shape-determining protein MreC
MRRERQGLSFRHLVFAGLLAFPPGVRLGMHLLREERQVDPSELKKLQIELEAARDELRREKTAREMSGLDRLDGQYRLVAGKVLPVSDPSPERSILWVHVGEGLPAPEDTAAVWGKALVGRVYRAYGRLPLLRVQTLLDPGFRVRFRHQEAAGMLWGTGRKWKGHPVLEIRHLAESAELKPGEPVFTDGNDGIYPEGILIGHLAEENGETEGSDAKDGAGKGPARRQLVVRGAIPADGLRTLQFPVDTFRPDWIQARTMDRREGSRS